VLVAHGLPWIVMGLFLLGVLGLAVVAVALVVRVLRLVFRTVAGLDSGGRQVGVTRGRRLICPEPRCGQANPTDARYCARCGRPFQHDHDLDAYG
jgi:hypothetical protein